MKTVHEVSRLTGVSIRTLHHYDAIGLLKPSSVTQAGYRLYDDTALERLQMILLLRELRFPLKDIAFILDSPDYDRTALLNEQIRMLEMQKKRLSDLIFFARQIQETGVSHLDFSAFDHKQLDDYAAQAKSLWGKTEAYKEYEQKSAGKTRDQQQAEGDDLMKIFAEFGAIRHLSPADATAQALAAKLQQFITDHYYTCTTQILRGLGAMYAAGGSMTDNIDAAGGAGTAQFASEAISIFCDTAR